MVLVKLDLLFLVVENIAQEIISNTDVEMVNKMANLFNIMFGLDNNSVKKETTEISGAEPVMNDFMEKLGSGDLIYDKEPAVGTELVLDDEFIGKQVESYDKLLKSPIMQEIQDPKLVKKERNKVV